jgi:Mrp family chromosome partitioning ATPase/uncharacterized protein involved in exopolysaccharide biosynthesis
MSNQFNNVQALSVTRRAPSMEFEEGSAPGSGNPLIFVNDRLRGRWKWVILAGLVLAGGLAALGYTFAPVNYRSQGMVYVESTPQTLIHDVQEADALIKAEQFMATQAGIIMGDRVISRAVQLLRAKKFPQVMEMGAVQSFMEDLSVGPGKNTTLIFVQYESDDPKYSKAAVDSVLNAYMELNEAGQTFEETREDLDILKRQKETQLSGTQSQRQNFITGSRFVHSEPEAQRQFMVAQIFELQRVRSEIEQRVQMTGNNELTEEEMLALDDPTGTALEQFDPSLGEERRIYAEKKREVDAIIARGHLENSRVYLTARRELDALAASLEQHERESHAAWLASRNIQNAGSLQERLTSIDADIAELQSNIRTINEEMELLANFDREIARQQEEVDEFKSRIAALDDEEERIKAGRIVVQSWGSQPEMPTTDRRYQMGAVGGLAGLAFAVGFFLLLGTLDRKAYASAQLQSAAEFDCIGVLPDMTPSLSNDDEARELAAQCVHRVRNRIEILRRPGKGFVIAVTSPAQGDGKTSMAMALGWSYAAAGHSTVLVDCDFIGRALSLQTNRIGYEGVKEVIKAHKLNGEIAPVDQSNLSVLGIGRDPSMGPESVRKVDFERLFADLREKFEIVIVDTGPLLASVEALPITVTADGVVLAFRRGRSRKRLEECVRELRATGACYLGVIMNCADQSDCVRYSSMSRVSQDVIEAEKRGKDHRRESVADENRLLMALQKPAPEGH